MTILHLHSSLGFYGAEAVVLSLCRAQKQNGLTPIIGSFLSPDEGSSELSRRACEEGIETTSIPCEGRCDRTAVVAILDFVSSRKVDLLHSHSIKTDLYCAWLTWRYGIRYLATCHGWIRQHRYERWACLLDRIVLCNAAQIVTVSDEMQSMLPRFWVPLARRQVILNGIDSALWQSAQPVLRNKLALTNETVIGFVGRLALEKGLHHALPALADILLGNCRVKLVVVGDGPERERLVQSAAKLGISKQVVFVGYQSDMASVYSSFDLVIMPSLSEGTPMVLLEAMACGTPVVASAVGSISQIVQNGKTGILVAPRDEKALKSAVQKLLGDRSLALEIAEQAKALVKDVFGQETMAAQYNDIYRRILATTH